MKTIVTFDVEDELAEKSIGIAEVALATAKMVYPEGKVQYKVFTERHAPFVSVDYFTDDLNEDRQGAVAACSASERRRIAYRVN